MADDSLATPISKLPSVSTREISKPSSGGDVSYADILKQQEMERHQFDQHTQDQQQHPPPQPQFQQMEMPMNHPGDHGTDHPMNSHLPPQQQMMASQQYDMAHALYGAQQPSYGEAPPPPQQGQHSPKKWWRIWLLENKTGWIVAFVIFLLLTFVYPRVRNMPRFTGMPLPYWATGGMAALGATLVTAISISV